MPVVRIRKKNTNIQFCIRRPAIVMHKITKPDTVKNVVLDETRVKHAHMDTQVTLYLSFKDETTTKKKSGHR